MSDDGLAGFAEGDPRLEISLADQARAAGWMRDPKRWHRSSGADWLAVRLRHGCGVEVKNLAPMFRVSERSIHDRKRAEKWVAPMSERDRRELAMGVWFAGRARAQGCDPEQVERLKQASEWRMALDASSYAWRPNDENGAPRDVVFQNSGALNDGRQGAWRAGAGDDADDLRRELQISLYDRLDAWVAGGDGPDGAEAEGAGVAGEPGGPGESGEGEGAVADLGDAGAALAGGSVADVAADGRPGLGQDAGGGGVGAGDGEERDGAAPRAGGADAE